jgi:hypothetical protein
MDDTFDDVVERVAKSLNMHAPDNFDPATDDMTVEFAVKLSEQDAEIASLRAELASRQIDVETFSEANRQLRTELSAKDVRIAELDSALLSYMDDWAEETILALRAAARQGAEDRAADIEAAEKRGYDCGVNDITRQDAEEKARLQPALKRLVDKLDLIGEDPQFRSVWTMHKVHGGNYTGPTYVEELKEARAALACRP